MSQNSATGVTGRLVEPLQTGGGLVRAYASDAVREASETGVLDRHVPRLSAIDREAGELRIGP